MNIDKTQILRNICYTELVYDRINKKLQANFSNTEIEILMLEIIEKTGINNFKKIGKNFYISNFEKNVRITINSNTFRIITVDKIKNDKWI
ncbi:DUF3781 domain-containing protein [Tenacibaculum maritimum]|uniref:DUF3781 domain-containing protein n=1 Tax=Tenacibaculum maritimum TaxID=107401 RepID=UPI001E5A23C8|nr:DUF3781 domain-containing protein [Tenacibaculum maritimum]MCD9612051.1 DUF3781 domain-containing protein [Tenacibaculum maritimum]